MEGAGIIYALLAPVIMIAAVIIVLVAIWRGMRAHESIAQSLKQIAQK